MKKIITLSVFMSFFSFNIDSQNITLVEYGGEYMLPKNDASNPCVTPEVYKSIEKQIKEYTNEYGIVNTSKNKIATTAFSWPLKVNNGLNDCSYYYIGNYLDQDPTSSFKDYNCGTVTYDGHAGTDICLCPYPIYKMDNNQVSVIAAAAGTISAKVDGNFDKNCASNTLTPNYIAVNHADGSNSIYLHMKKNSLTAKTIGQTVVTGEYLGSVGSSGSSSGPHLHFEVWSGNTNATLKDSYSGPCNTLNASSWWANQKPYTEPAIIKAQINTVAPVLPACPATETSNEDSCFTGGASVRFYIFIRNETSGMVANMRIINPNGTTFSSWVHNSNTNYQVAYWYAVKPLPTASGTYTFESIYNGITCTKTFSINCSPTVITDINDVNKFDLYPNPASDNITITASEIDNDNYRFSLKNVIGQVLLEDQAKVENKSIQKIVPTAELPKGIYFISIESNTHSIVKKFIKN